MNKVLLLIGSHSNKSSSACIAHEIRRFLSEKNYEVITMSVNKKYSEDILLYKLIICDIVLIISPIYIDTPPSKMLKLISDIKICINKNGTNIKYISAICNCGFYESSHNKISLDIFRCFSDAIGAKFIQGLGIGCGELIKNLHNIKDGNLMKKKLLELLKSFADTIIDTNYINAKTINDVEYIFFDFHISKKEYVKITYDYWQSIGKKNNLNFKEDYCIKTYNYVKRVNIMRFENKIVVISGGSRGIGNAIVRGFANEGGIVHFTYQNQSEELSQLMNDAKENNWKIYGTKVNSANIAEVNNFIDRFEQIDVFINNAGIIRDNLLSTMKEEEWSSVIDANLNGCFYYINGVSKKMIYARSGSIILVSSISGINAVKGQGNYSATKAATIALSKTLAVELAQKKIRVNSIAPGFIDTVMVKELPDKKKDEYISKIPMKRFGQKEEVVNVIKFLASEESSYITGQCIVVDGGRSVQ